MMTFPDLASLPSDRPAAFTDQLRLAVAAYLARLLRVCGKGTKVVLIPLPPAVARAIDPGHSHPYQRPDPAQHPGRLHGLRHLIQPPRPRLKPQEAPYIAEVSVLKRGGRTKSYALMRRAPPQRNCV
jgi:hypothetical protein